MNNKYSLIFIVLWGLSAWTGQPASGQGFSPKREFRAAWVATVSNIDWPSRKGLSPDLQKAEFCRLLDTLKNNHFNAVIVQVRPKADAFYNSSSEPWSEYLTGRQGENPGYDPLEFMVRAAHERGLELHAWLNPFRVTTGEALSKLSAGNVGRRHPEWLVSYGGRYYLDPGLHEVRQYLLDVIAELLEKYDLDALHLDDYFYPYPQGKTPFPDGKSYQKYGASLFPDIAQWRRENVNQLVKGISDEIKALKPGVKFGISPFGIYLNASDGPGGSATRGLSNYKDLYADVAMWAREGWIDYVLPQLYWERGHPSADYTELLDWWGKNSGKAQLYIGHGIYNVSAGSLKPVWRTPQEICAQIDLQRANPVSAGSAHYSVKYLMGNICGLTDSLRSRYANQALAPPIPRMDARLPLSAANVATQIMPQGIKVSWTGSARQDAGHADLPAKTQYYAVYRFSDSDMINLNDSSHLLGRVWVGGTPDGTLEYFDRSVLPGKWVYVITSVSPAGMENEDFAVSTLVENTK